MSQYRRRRAAVSLLLLVAACGGGDAADPTNPPPPPPPPPPAQPTIAISAGDGQQAASAAPVAVAPAVIVRDAQGQPVAGATVQFAVTAGGGRVDGAAPTTGADGIARVTRWTLGTAGDQRLSATTGGAAPVVFRATVVPGTELLPITVPTTGGAFEITTPGHPYEGLTLTVPAGTYAAPAQVTMRVAPTQPTLALPAGYRVAGPALEIATDAPRGAHLMTLDVPVARTANEDVVIALQDPASGAIEVLPTVARTATSVRVMTGHLRADLLLGATPATPSLARAGAAGAQGSRMFGIGNLIPILQLIPTLPVTPVLSAGALWPVADHGSAAFPDGHGAAIPIFQALASLGSSLSGTLSQLVRPLLATPGFYADAAPLAALQIAHRTISPTVNVSLSELGAALGLVPKPERDELVHRNIVAALGIGRRPIVLAFPGAGGGSIFGTAFAGAESSISFVPAASLGVTELVRDVTSGFQALSLHRTGDAPPEPASGAVGLSSFVVPFESIANVLRSLDGLLEESTRKAVNDALAAQAGMPAVALEQEGVPGGGWSAEDAAKGEVAVRSSGSLLRQVGRLGRMMMVHLANGAVAARTEGDPIRAGSLAGLAALPPLGALDHIFSPVETIGGRMRQIRPETFRLIWAPYRVTPEKTEVGADDLEVAFEASVPAPPSAGFRIRWDWGDGTSSENLSLTNATHRYADPGDYKVVSTLLARTGSFVLAVDTVDVESEDAAPYWQITSISDPDEIFGDDNEGSGALYDLLQRVLATPAAGMIAIEPNGSGHVELQLRVRRAGTWSAADCCRPADPAAEWVMPLGVTPPATHQVGPFFAGWERDFWTQSTEDLGSGTMQGQQAFGLRTYNIKDAGSQVGPAGAVRLTATRNGTTMTGTITLTVWWIDDETGEVREAGEDFRLPFTAKRFR